MTWKMRNVLNQMKNQFSDFLFLELWSLLYSKLSQFLINFHDNSKNQIRKIHFSFVSAHCALSIKTKSKLNVEGGVCISVVGKYSIACEYNNSKTVKALNLKHRLKSFPHSWSITQQVLRAWTFGRGTVRCGTVDRKKKC